MIIKKRRIIQICCFLILILLGCFGCNKQDGETKAARIKLSGNDSGNAVLSGTDKNGEDFYINLDYLKDDVIVNDSYYIDLTEDGNDELCIELNIKNNMTSDMNTILVYDSDNWKLLFPNESKAFIYDGETASLGTDQVILYRSFDKINGVGIESEYSVVKWNGSDFVSTNYYKKLLAENDDYVVFYDNTEDSADDNSFHLKVLNPKSLKPVQEIEIVPDKEANIPETINQGTLLVPDTTVGVSTDDLYMEGYGILHWNRETKSFESVPHMPEKEEVERIYYGEEYLETSAPATFVCDLDYKGDRDQFTKKYLQDRGMYQEEPDGIAYGHSTDIGLFLTD